MQVTTRAQTLPAPIMREWGDEAGAIVCLPVFEELCVNANGDIVCSSCDVTGKRVYGNVFKDRIADVYNGPMYREMRDWLLRSRPDSWCPAISHHCPRRITPAGPQHGIEGCRVKVLKLEPVTYCNLHCPACPVETNFKQDAFLQETRARKLLPLETMLDVVAQLPDLETILYYNFGEPFFHKDTVAFLREVRRTRPDVQVMTNTAGLVMTPAQIEAIALEALIDKVVFSIDGATPESYRKYRVGGDFSKAMKKMSALVDACRAAGTWHQPAIPPRGAHGVHIVWQYILFEWNDSDEELRLAQSLAREMGIPIDWVMTCGPEASKRFLHGSAEVADLINRSASYVSVTAPAGLSNRLQKNEMSARDFDVFKQIRISCELKAVPYIRTWTEYVRKRINGALKERFKRLMRAAFSKEVFAAYLTSPSYAARFRADELSLRAPPGAVIVLRTVVENRTGQTWDAARSDFLRLGVQLRKETNELLAEVGAAPLPAQATVAGARIDVPVRVTLPRQPGRYRLLIDVVQECVSWFSDQGSTPLICSVTVE